MDPYGRFFLSDRKGAYPVDVELVDGYYVREDSTGKKALTGPQGTWTELKAVLRLGFARII
jgi:hypothetical protein